MKNRNTIRLIIVLIALIVVSAIGTIELMRINGYRMVKTAYADANNPLRILFEDSYYTVMYDELTGVMYLDSYHGDLTIMLNADGLPRVYEYWRDSHGQ